jgi:hypothetical protein
LSFDGGPGSWYAPIGAWIVGTASESGTRLRIGRGIGAAAPRLSLLAGVPGPRTFHKNQEPNLPINHNRRLRILTTRRRVLMKFDIDPVGVLAPELPTAIATNLFAAGGNAVFG